MIRIFQVFIPTSVLTLLLSEITLLFACFVLATFVVVEPAPEVFLLYEGGIAQITVVVLSIVAGLYFHDLYTNVRVRNTILLIQQICVSIGLSFLVQALLIYASRGLFLPRARLMILGSAFTLVVLPTWRNLYSRFVLQALGGQKVLFVGMSPLVHEIVQRLNDHPELGLLPVGYLEDQEEPDPELPAGGAKRLGCIRMLEQTAQELKPERIVVGLEDWRNRIPVQELLQLRLSGIQILDISSIYEAAFGRICTRQLRPSQLIFSPTLGPGRHRVALQTFYSEAIAILGTMITLPLMLLVAVAIRLSSKGPILYRQRRVGLHDTEFELYKFRSMFVDAEAGTGAVWAQENDPRVTPIGRWLRLLRLDELPQFFNVLRGDMVIVGPRPERPEFVKTLSEQIPYYRLRHSVKPGITGWAQINYKYSNTLEDTVTKLEYDLYYVKNIRLSLDFYIIFHTLKTMLLSRGAH